MKAEDLENLKRELQKIKEGDELPNEKVIKAINTMPWIRNKNVRKAYAEITSLVYEVLM